MKILLWMTAAAASLTAQSDYYPRHNFTVGVGGAQPRAELRGLFLSRPVLSVAYGYRFARYFQADAGLDTVFGAGQVRDYLDTPLGPSRIRDYQFFVPLGGRAILPVAGGRLLLSGGGGVAYLRYTERLRQLSDYLRVDCPVCNSRQGVGYYALVGTDVFLDRRQHWRLGVTTKVYRGHTEGDPLGPVPGVRTRDHWLHVLGEFGVSF